MRVTIPRRKLVAAISRLTGAPIVEPARARFALALDEPADFSDLNPGSHWSPEQGAMLVQRVAAISDVSDTSDTSDTSDAYSDAATSGSWRLTGPGVAPHCGHDRPRHGPVGGLADHPAGARRDYPAGHRLLCWSPTPARSSRLPAQRAP